MGIATTGVARVRAEGRYKLPQTLEGRWVWGLPALVKASGQTANASVCLMLPDLAISLRLEALWPVRGTQNAGTHVKSATPWSAANC